MENTHSARRRKEILATISEKMEKKEKSEGKRKD
jgi:hypothetical protein